MKIILTGAAGFLGSCVLKRLAGDENNEIICITRSSIKTDKENVKVRTGDIIDKDFVLGTVKDADVVIHLAGKTPKFFSQDMYKAMMTNVIGTHNLIEAIKGIDTKLVFASSHLVYGASNPPFCESVELNPKNPYEISKAISEMEIRDSLDNYLVLRFANLFGYYKGNFLSTGVVAKMIDSAYNNGLIKVTGNRKIGFLHVDDAADAVIKTIEMGGIFNVGGRAISLLELAGVISRKLKLLTGKETNIEEISPSGENEDVWVSIEKIKAIGWVPTDSETAIEKTLNEYLCDKK